MMSLIVVSRHMIRIERHGMPPMLRRRPRCPKGILDVNKAYIMPSLVSLRQESSLRIMFNLDLNLDSTCVVLGLEVPGLEVLMLRRYFLTNLTLLVGSIQHW